jgi:predicted SAM-dependent methyltransferase
MKINLGCGRDYRKDYVNTDISHETKADYYFDVSKDLFPFEDNSADEIYCSGVLEQILTNEGLINAMNESYRVLKNNGLFIIVVPNAKYAVAHQDPMDVRKFTIPTFDYFIKGNRHYDLYGSVYGFKPWKMDSIEENERGILIVKLLKCE